MRRFAALTIAVLISGPGLAACSSQPAGRAGSSAGSAATTGSATADTATARRLVGQVAGVDVLADVRPIVTSDDGSLLTVDLTATKLDGQSSPGFAFLLHEPFQDIGSVSFDDVRLVDPRNRKVYLVAGVGNRRLATAGGPQLKDGSRQTLQAAFASLPSGTTTVDVMIGKLGYLRAVPVQTGPVPQDVNATPTAEPNAYLRAKVTAQDLARIDDAPVFDLEAYTEQLAGAVRERTSPTKVTISLDTTVLFALDRSDLTSRASAALRVAARAIQSRGPGSVEVRGYTDDTGTTAHNLTLSTARARSVSAALGALLGSGYRLHSSGLGEQDPQLPNTSEANRRLNRRVEVTVDGPGETAAASATASDRAPSTGAPGATATLEPGSVTGTEQVTVQDDATHGVPLRIQPISLQRTDGTLVLTLDVANTSTSAKVPSIGGLLSAGAIGNRGEFSPSEQYSASGVRLLTGDLVTYPMDYQRERNESRGTLADLCLNQPLPAGGGHQSVTVVFPDPAGAPSVVDVDVPGEFRLLKVPVSG